MIKVTKTEPKSLETVKRSSLEEKKNNNFSKKSN